MKKKLPLRFISHFLKNTLINKFHGFTLIEILVAISIIAILSTVGFSVYTQGQKLARDSKRKADLKQIQTALNLYYQDFKAYPNTLGGSCASSGGGYTQCISTATSSATQPWIRGLDSNYIDLIPVDPFANTGEPAQSDNYGYGYRVYGAICNKTANQVYVLYAKLENKDDPDRLAAKNYNFCESPTPQSLMSVHNWKGDLYVLSSYF